MIGFCIAFASADQTNIVVDFASALYYAMQAAKVTVSSTVAPFQDVLDSINYGAGMPWTPNFTYQGPTWDNDILNMSSVYVRPGFVEIDGVSYTDIWLSNDASQKFRVNAFDLETAWNIVSNSNGTYASGVGYILGAPAFSINGSLRYQTQAYFFSAPSSFSIGSSVVNVQLEGGYNQPRFILSDVSIGTLDWTGPYGTNGYTSGTGIYYFDTERDRNAFTASFKYVDNDGFTRTSEKGRVSSSAFVSNSFDFDWVSGTVPAETLPSNYGLHIQVPDSYTDPQSGDVIYDFGDLVQEYPDQSNGKEVNFDPDINPDAQVDVDFTNDLWQILRTILQVLDLLDNVEIEYGPKEEPQPEPSPEPSPPPSPVPSTPVSDQPAEWLDQILRWIQETINSVKTSTQSLEDILEDILTQVQTLPQQILEDIETAPISIYRTSLEIIKTVFAPVLLLLKATIGLWHYVVEWVQATAPVFSSFFGLMNGTNYNMVLPIYASLAGPIVISVYKRFGK